ncbi:MAG: undecaprenyl-diphosphate phosphatase [Candidatus Vogelbacteria bacterium]|nr:undecaprenyl-diphosphate phosphatase [Candidatus Vogelbacteria bacterium]
MGFLHSIILGIVEGITEFLPVSSTGHLILASQLLRIGESDFVKSFEIIIQLGAILAVVVLYWKKLWNWETIKKLLVAFLPTAIIGLALYKIVKTYLLGNTAVVLWSLFLGGFALIIFELWYEHCHLGARLPKGEKEALPPSYRQAVAIGLFQSIAIIPGVSRSAATIVGGLWLGLSRATIVEFSFLLAVPTMLAATGLDLIKNYQSFSADQFGSLTVGFVVSFLVALAAIKFLLNYIRKYDFIPFGIYRIILALIFWFLVV